MQNMFCDQVFRVSRYDLISGIKVCSPIELFISFWKRTITFDGFA